MVISVVYDVMPGTDDVLVLGEEPLRDRLNINVMQSLNVMQLL